MQKESLVYADFREAVVVVAPHLRDEVLAQDGTRAWHGERHADVLHRMLVAAVVHKRDEEGLGADANVERQVAD